MSATLKERLDQDLKSSMKNGDELRVSTIRMLRAAIKNKEIELIKKNIEDEEIFSLIRKMVKQRHESIDQFKKGNRPDLVQKEQKEITILEPYLPKSLNIDEIEKRIQTVIAKLGASSPKDMGAVMKAVGQELQGQADMKDVSRIVKEKLTKVG